MADTIGSLEPGKAADIVVHSTSAPGWVPRGDIAHQLIWSSDGRGVRDVLVAGRVVVRDRVCQTVDEAALREEAERVRSSLLARAGIAIPTTWPTVPAAGPAHPPRARASHPGPVQRRRRARRSAPAP